MSEKGIAIVFPGQGSQYVGMGKELYEEFEVVKEVFDSANEILGFDLKKVCFEGPEEELKRTSIAQPAILTLSVALWKLLPPIPVRFLAGHSLGEYSALVAGDVLTFSEAVSLVRKRGEYMERARKGTMFAILKLRREVVEELVRECNGICVVANYNSPQQIVVSGEEEAVKEVARKAEEKGGRSVQLAVSGAFHSPLMEEANREFEKELDKVEFRDSAVPIVCNVWAKPLVKGEEIKQALKLQMVSPVHWEESVRFMGEGAGTFIEIGPGKVLTNLVKRILPEARTFNIEDKESFNRTIEELRKEGKTS